MGAALLTQLRPRASVVDGAREVARIAPRFAATFDATTFKKGNLHAHTDRSDGDSSPEDVIAWYRRHGYQFLALTDHDLRSEPAHYASLQDESFRLLPGEEITMTGAGRQVHVNALCTQRTIGGGAFASVADALVWAMSEIDGQAGVAIINHPNFDRALVAEDLGAARGAPLLEIESGHPYVYSHGINDRPSHEALWDEALGHGVGLMGVAVDDTHHLALSGDPPAYPGVGWVEVFAEQNDAETICGALRRGMLYASTGAELARIRVTAGSYGVWPRGAASVSFVGRYGDELRRVDVGDGAGAVYVLRGDESYVRARVKTAQGTAWAPSVFVAR